MRKVGIFHLLIHGTTATGAAYAVTKNVSAYTRDHAISLAKDAERMRGHRVTRVSAVKVG